MEDHQAKTAEVSCDAVELEDLEHELRRSPFRVKDSY